MFKSKTYSLASSDACVCVNCSLPHACWTLPRCNRACKKPLQDCVTLFVLCKHVWQMRQLQMRLLRCAWNGGALSLLALQSVLPR